MSSGADQTDRMDHPATIDAMLAGAAAAYGDQPALLDACGDAVTTTSHSELLAQTGRLAARLVGVSARSGRLRPRMAVVLPNGVALARSLLAITRLGEAAPLSPRLTRAEYADVFAQLRPDAVVVGGDSPDAAVAAAQAAGVPLRHLDDEAPADSVPAAAPVPDDVALVLMTSGSTGRAKVVPLTHRNVCVSACDVARSIRLTQEDRALVMWEQFHIGGLVDLLLAPLSVGGSAVLTEGFDASRVFPLLQETRPTWFQAVPTTLGELARHATANGDSGPGSLRLIRSVAAALTPELQETVANLFKVPVVRTLGMTEAGPLITSTPLPPEPQKPGSVGRPAGPAVRILGESGATTSAGVHGEVVVRGDNVFAGYEAGGDNAEAFVDGWFRTGDTGYFDTDGDLFLTGRLKDMINRGGEKISPAEVDAALQAVPGVREAACFAVPHATLNEDIVAAVVTDPDLDLDHLRAGLAERLAPHKIPSRIRRQESLPKTPVGKIDRPALAKAVAAQGDGAAEPPRDGMETFLAHVWAAELGKTVQGRTTDFASLDGDSLSAVRVVAAIEGALDTVLPDSVYDHVTCIADMAAFLAEHGYHAPSDPSGTDRHAQQPLGKDAPDGLTGFEPDFRDQVSTALAECRSRSAVSSLLKDLDRFCTLDDLSELAPHLNQITPGSANAAGLLGQINPMAFAMRLKLKEWLDRIAAERAASPAFGRWTKRVLGPACFFYEGQGGTRRGKTLVVAFAGTALQLGMPLRWFLSALDPERYDLALVVDPSRSRFEAGAPAAGTDMISLGEALGSLLPSRDYDRVAGFGHSAGAHVAVIAGYLNDWDTVVTLVPARQSEHPELSAQFEAAMARFDTSASRPRLVCVRGTRDKEIEAMEQLCASLGAVSHVVEPVAGKGVVLQAYREARLAQLLDTVLS